MTTAAEFEAMFDPDGTKPPKGHMELLYEANPELRREHMRERYLDMQADRAKKAQEYLDKLYAKQDLNGSRSIEEMMRY